MAATPYPIDMQTFCQVSPTVDRIQVSQYVGNSALYDAASLYFASTPSEEDVVVDSAMSVDNILGEKTSSKATASKTYCWMRNNVLDNSRPTAVPITYRAGDTPVRLLHCQPIG